MGPLYHHLYSAEFSKSVLGAFHYRVFLQDSAESARDNNVDELVYDTEECNGSVVVDDGDVFVFMNEDYFCF